MKNGPIGKPLLVLLVALLFMGCDTGNLVEVDKSNFEGEKSQQENIIFSFNKDLYPDSLLYQWDSTEYVTFTPQVAGRFKWNSSSELVFSPATGFAPETTYKCTLNKAITRYSKKKYDFKESTVSFSTEALKLTQTNISWVHGNNMGNVVVALDMYYNYDVAVAEAAAHTTVSSAGKTVTTTTINNGNSRLVSLQFMPLNDLDEVTPLDIHVAKGITITNGNKQSALDTTIESSIPSRFNLAINNMASSHTGTEGVVTITTSQPIEAEGLKQLINIEPSIPFELETSGTGITITSDKFLITGKYQVTISKNIEGLFGGKMKEDFVEDISFKELEPDINFADSKGMFLSTNGNRNIAVNIVNTPKVKLTISKIYENNMEYFLRRGTSYGYDYSDDEYHSYRYYDIGNIGDEVYTEEFETAKLPRQNGANVLHLDFRDKIKSFDGTYIISIQSSDKKWVQASRIVNLSDIGLIMKSDDNNVYVFANSIRYATPLAGVSIAFISTNNQVLEIINTDNEGVAKLSDLKEKHPGFKVGLVTAKKDGEFSFISMNKHQVETSRFDVGGRYPNSTQLNAMVYAERNLYRPGEQVHVSTIVRTETWDLPGEIPVKLQLVMPNGKTLAVNRKILNKEGGTETSFDIPPTAITGTYTLNVLTGNDVLLNNYAISIEDFMPDRIKATMTLDKEDYNYTDSIRTTIQVDNLFGTPAANRNYEAELNIDKKRFTVKALPDYDFSISNDINYSYEYTSGKTDDNGSASFAFSMKKDIAGKGMLQGSVMATIFDETGRPIHRYSNFKVYTQPVFIGIRYHDYYVGTRTPQKVQLVATDKTGKILTGAVAHVTLIKKDWHTVIQQNGNSYRYISQKEEKTLKETKITINGKSTVFNFTPEQSGEYEVRISPDGYSSYVSTTFYAWGYSDTHYSSFEVNNEGNVTIKPGKDKYQTGEDVKLLFTTPFEGRMLVTLERGSIQEHIFLETENRSASYSFKASDAQVPNVYVTATLFRPMDDAQMPLTVAHGFRSVKVERPSSKLPVNITVADKSRSKTKQAIQVKTEPGAYVTIAAVDEGILQVKNYNTPDPYQYFYQKVALTTHSYDVYPFLMPEIKTLMSSTGGDGAALSAMRANPLFVNRVKNVSFWSGIKQADSKGIVSYDIDIPQFSGDIRVMALAYKHKGFGSAEEHMKVADPIVISTALPRFFSPSDKALVSVNITNTTSKDATARVNMNVSGPLSIDGEATESIKIAANKEQRVIFKVNANKAIGKAKVNVSIQALNETFTNETEISVRPAAGLQKTYIAGEVNSGKTKQIDITNKYIPATADGKLVVSKSPLAEFSRDLTELVRYPYGCVEQTTSTAFPQLYYYDLVKSVASTESNDMNPGYNVRQAILKLQSMQMSNGALTYWPGGGYESWWGTIYAAHFLLEAKKAGYPVNARTLEKIQGYLVHMLKERKTCVVYYNNNTKKEIAAKEVAYSLFVLSLAGNPQYATMNYYKAHPSIMSMDSRYMLAAAYAIAGQKQKALESLPHAFDEAHPKPSFGGSFYSYIRDLALSLYAVQEIDPQNAQIPTLARMLSTEMHNSRYLNTQERSFGILALGKIAQRANKTQATATVTANGKNIITTDGKEVTTGMKPYMGQNIQMSVKGTGPYYYFAETSGITEDGSFKEEDSYLRARKTFYTRSGKLITGDNFKQNDLIVVQLTLEAQYNEEIENVVLTDILPAGFEIENTRLHDMPDLDWIKKFSEPDYLDMRDDRVNIFTTAGREKQYFYYMVRAVSPGTYRMGPVQADAMYNGAFHSYNGAGTITITGD